MKAHIHGACSPMNTAQPPIVWTIAGSDSGGGAGIQADLATIQDFGGHGCSVITTVTAQSSVAVTLVEPVSDAMLLAQLTTLLTDLPPKAIKIGLLASQVQVSLLADWLAGFKTQYPWVPVIIDPVMVASCGDELMAESRGESSLDFSPFNGLLDLITPNGLELGRLTQLPTSTPAQFAAAAKALSNRLSCSVLAKGGDVHGVHNDWLAECAADFLLCRGVQACSDMHSNCQVWLSSPRIDTQHNHGSGCTLSSAIAAVLAQGFVLQDAVVVAKAYVNRGLSLALGLGQGPGPLVRSGWPKDLHTYPTIHQDVAGIHQRAALVHQSATEIPNAEMRTRAWRFKPLASTLGIYPVVNCLAMLEALLVAGVNTVQLRIKTVSTELVGAELAALEAQIQTAIALAKHFNAQLFINDHWRLAIKHGAFGVHLGQEDLAVTDLAAIQEAGLALGVSSHGYFELLLAHQYAPSYVALGHIFPTTTKQMPSAPQGLYKLKHYVDLLQGHYPLVAIGGINLDNLDRVKATGVANIAVVRALTEATDIAVALRQLNQAWECA
jgi:hydroxymethylpyrimidine kinase/phosphomethylpyrimidine kinase/thiamine-phosphate diphosphorylase